MEEGTKRFERRHLASSIGSLVLGIIITLLIFPQFQVAAPNGGFEVYIKLFCTAFGFGFGWHAIVSEGASWAGAFREVLLTIEVILGYIMLGGLISIFANKLARRS